MSLTPGEASSVKLRLTGVSRNFAGLHAVRDVNLELQAGERRTVLGPNGAGKTTLFNLVAGTVPVSAGRIEFDGEDITSERGRTRVRRGLTRTYQHSQLLDELTLAQNLRVALLGARGGGYSFVRRRQQEARLDEEGRQLADLVGLTVAMDTQVAQISHGEKRQLEIAVALAGAPTLLLLDEPAAGLGPAERHGLTDLLRSLDRSVTLLLIEHDMDVALAVADWVTVMHDGRVVADARPDAVLNDPLVLDLYLGRGAAAPGTTSEASRDVT